MDPEPERCRRTDGKKWRCYQPVVPNEKYCEKHMHRGRKRSRKLVETITTDPPNVSKNPFEVQVTRNRKSPPLNESGEAVIEAPCLTDIVEKRAQKVEKSNEVNHNMIVKSAIAAINLGPGLNLFLKSIHEDDQRCSEDERQVRAPRLVSQRCSRTDGRKWQCHNEPLPGQKYCAQHINRGLKKPAAISPRTNVSSSTPKCAVPKQAETGMDLDTNMSISLPMKLDDPEHNVRDTTTGSSNNSSETTISDDIAYISNLSAVSPGMQQSSLISM